MHECGHRDLTNNSRKVTTTMMVFEFARGDSVPPITVFADELRQAEELFRRWSQAHDPEFNDGPPNVFPFNAQWLELRPLLRSAVKRVQPGIGYWDERSFAWVTHEPEDETDLPLAPAPGKVRLYRFDCEERLQELVFAMSYDEAVRLFCLHHIELWGSLPTSFTARETCRWTLSGPLAVLRDQLEAEITGVAQRDRAEGWRVLPADWEAPVG